MLRRTWCIGGMVALVLALSALKSAARPPEGLATLRDGFESPRPSWRQEEADLTVRLLEHERSDKSRHGGERSERFHFLAQGPGSAIYYSLPLPKIPIVEEQEVSLYVRSNQPGVQLLARVVLPGDTDPDTGQPAFVLVAGTIAQEADHWSRLELSDLRHGVEEQARLLRVKTGRKMPAQGAYLERLVVNLYGGPGETEVFLDDLTISPVPDSAILAEAAGGAVAAPKPDETPSPPPVPAATPAAPATSAPVKLQAGGRILAGARLVSDDPVRARRRSGGRAAVWVRCGGRRSRAGAGQAAGVDRAVCS